MKVKPIEHKGEKMVKFWCPGCGVFHVALEASWNSDLDNPDIDRCNGVHDSDRYCLCHVKAGVIHFDPLCTHRLKGQSVPMQHEEAWREDGHKWDEVKPVPQART
jgi:hypothetical protein